VAEHDRGRPPEQPEPRRWLVGGGLVVSDGAVLLVQNRRRDGRLDWSPPGGVIDAGEGLLAGLTREVEEETGLRIGAWSGPAYRIEADAPDMGWHLTVEAHVAEVVAGELRLDDPDGIVVDARFVSPDECTALVSGSPQWVREPLCSWLGGSAVGAAWSYRVTGALGGGRRIEVVRLSETPAQGTPPTL
jgi:8-oxo-dGTP diphosphatase